MTTRASIAYRYNHRPDPGAHNLPAIPDVLFQPAQIHNYEQPRVQRSLRRVAIDHAFLQPDSFRSDGDRRVNRLACFVRTSKNIDEIDLVRNCGQPRIRLLAKHLSLVWINRYDPV